MNPQQESKDHKIRIGITHGDVNGVSYEIMIKTFLDHRLMELFTPIIYGSSKVASYHRKVLNITDFSLNLIKKAEFANPKRPNIINCYEKEVKIELGKSTNIAGELSFLALEQACNDLINKSLDILVTTPINKANIQSENFKFPGHTEYLAEKFNSEDVLMVMIHNNLRIGVITGHIPLKEVAEKITKELILKKIKIFHDSLVVDFNIQKPKIAVLGLNPHSSDSGLLGEEEEKFISPAIQEAMEENMLVFGPFAADGFFGSSNYTHFDAILATYHDQGLIPFKTLAFDEGVNYSAGLPFVRTSPAHGIGYEIAGKNVASPNSFRQAIYLGMDIYKNRQEYQELLANPLERGRLEGEANEKQNKNSAIK